VAFFTVKVQFGSIFSGWRKTAPSSVKGKGTSEKTANLNCVSLDYVFDNFVTDENENSLEAALEFLHLQKELLSIKLKGTAMAELVEKKLIF